MRGDRCHGYLLTLRAHWLERSPGGRGGGAHGDTSLRAEAPGFAAGLADPRSEWWCVSGFSGARWTHPSILASLLQPMPKREYRTARGTDEDPSEQIMTESGHLFEVFPDILSALHTTKVKLLLGR
ncbi:hypothetical protein E2C01_045118 [Portunus trituberculatus]|uniref:Uncharacterized protein n=1 Tax=Portunus trituberculatus TaxID=210409 RepID=A0A5B7FUV7_PORTR|nr:hypothetical protein [Portunus trituberculatus]